MKDGTANRKCVFEIFTRHLPLGRHYGVVNESRRFNYMPVYFIHSIPRLQKAY